jgi:hypothetical protein
MTLLLYVWLWTDVSTKGTDGDGIFYLDKEREACLLVLGRQCPNSWGPWLPPRPLRYSPTVRRRPL